MSSSYLMNLLASAVAVIVGIVIHESAHAAAAWALGDKTARSRGRVSLNPLNHIDPFGTVMIHRVCFGSIERFIGILTEHYAGAFPLWLAPVQVKVMPITDRTNNYAKHVADRLEKAGLRVETDLRNEKIGYKIREAQMQKIPYMLVVGDKEAEAGTVSVRTRAGVDLGAMPLDEFMAKIGEEISTRSKD